MLRKLLWAVVNAGALFAARKGAVRLWRLATGEEPPIAKK
jgi:hypothetical protein